jgi:hypothetical protein
MASADFCSEPSRGCGDSQRRRHHPMKMALSRHHDVMRLVG